MTKPSLRRYRSHHDLNQCGIFDSSGGYRSHWYEGYGPGMEWLRLTLDGGCTPHVCIYAVDQLPVQWDGSLKPTLERDAHDLSLYGVYGRYLCFTLSSATHLQGFSLAFPGHSIDAGLPFVLQGDTTLRQFLAVYQSIYMDTNHLAAQFPQQLDPKASPTRAMLSNWVGAARWIRNSPDEINLLPYAVALNRMRGTRRGLELLISLVTGGSGTIVESHQWNQLPLSAHERDTCARLYGADPACVTLLLPSQTSSSALHFLEYVLEDFIPLGVTYRVVALHDGSHMDAHSYLDINAHCTEPPQPLLDEGVLDELILE